VFHTARALARCSTRAQAKILEIEERIVSDSALAYDSKSQERITSILCEASAQIRKVLADALMDRIDTWARSSRPAPGGSFRKLS